MDYFNWTEYFARIYFLGLGHQVYQFQHFLHFDLFGILYRKTVLFAENSQNSEKLRAMVLKPSFLPGFVGLGRLNQVPRQNIQFQLSDLQLEHQLIINL